MTRLPILSVFVCAVLAPFTACELYEHHPPTCRERLVVCPGDGGTAGEDGGEGGGDAGTHQGGSGTAGTAGGSAGSAGRGGSTGGGSGGTEPCDGACGGATPVCDEAREVCVECLDAGDCSETAPFCDAASRSCVECRRPSDCADPEASRCNDGLCETCESNADCTHVAGLGICDIETRACVECTVETEATACGANSCDPKTNECTTTPRGTLIACRPCLADSECVGGNIADPDVRCVPMEFEGTARAGGFCLRRAAKTCQRPFTVTFMAGSLSGAATERYCGIDQDNVTCEAVRDQLDARSCAGNDAACGCTRDEAGVCTGPGLGGRCETVGGIPNQCTYGCADTLQCNAVRTCNGSPGFCE